MTDPLHPSQLPDDWKDQLARAYAALALGPIIPQPGSSARTGLRNRKTGRFLRQRNDPEVMAHAPSPYKELIYYPAPLHNLVRLDGQGLPKDVYENLERYLDRRPAAAQWNRETANVIRNARGNPTLPVTVFRPVPWVINHFSPDDTVVLSPSFAKASASAKPRWRTISATVPARELFTSSDNDLMRWRWRGNEPITNGTVITVPPTRARRPRPRPA